VPTFAFLWKSDPLRENLQHSVPKAFTASPVDVFCANFVKFGQREIGKFVRYLPDNKNKNFTSLSGSRLYTDLTQNLQG